MFEFNKKNKLELNIAGEIFYVNYGPEMIKKLKSEVKTLSTRVKELSACENIDESFNETIKLCRQVIDYICGDGASNRIFKDGDYSLLDYYDVIIYITDEISKYKDNTLGKYSVKRALRK